MGDRTTVTLTVLKKHAPQAKNFFPDEAEELDRQFITNDEPAVEFTDFTFYEVNYGELDFLDDLTKAGIPYTSEWESGYSYSAGEQHSRFTETGGHVLKEFNELDHYFALSDLLKHIDTPDVIKELILEKKDELEVLPWFNQAEYAKRYLAKQLITPKE
mgnify:CR=1 FL=1